MNGKSPLLIALTGLAVLVSSCGKEALFKDRLSQVDFPGWEEAVGACDLDRLLQWNFVQPQPETGLSSVDILFVMDSSASLSAERQQLAAAVPEFLASLDGNIHYRIAAIHAHGGASPLSGKISSAPGTPRVLDPRVHSVPKIQEYLRKTLALRVRDADEAEGEALLYSLTRAATDRLASNQALGFFRADAALSVVLVTDENDLCFVPEDHGFSGPAHSKPSPGNAESIARSRYCLNADGTERITPESTLAQLKSLKGTKQVSLGGIIHTDEKLVPSDGEDSIGHGILQLLDLSLNSVRMELSSLSYSEKLQKLARIISRQLRLKTEFRLDGHDRADPATLAVAVDGARVEGSFDPASGTLQIRAEDAGGAGSRVSVVACPRVN